MQNSRRNFSHLFFSCGSLSWGYLMLITWSYILLIGLDAGAKKPEPSHRKKFSSANQGPTRTSYEHPWIVRLEDFLSICYKHPTAHPFVQQSSYLLVSWQKCYSNLTIIYHALLLELVSITVLLTNLSSKFTLILFVVLCLESIHRSAYFS